MALTVRIRMGDRQLIGGIASNGSQSSSQMSLGFAGASGVASTGRDAPTTVTAPVEAGSLAERLFAGVVMSIERCHAPWCDSSRI